jgi:transposase
MIVRLWVRRDETNPEPNSDGKYPRERKRKREPASPCPMFKSLSIVGNKGARNTLERKLRKKMRVTQRRGGI